MFNRIKKMQEEGNSRVFAFGAGKRGIKLSDEFKKRNIRLSAFFDNDCSKQGSRINGIEVLSPQRIGENDICVISNIEYEGEIRNQLKPFTDDMHVFGIEEVYRRSHDYYSKLIVPYEQNPIVSVVLTIFNGWDYTYNCIESFLEVQTNIPYELIVGDNNSTDQTSEMEAIIHGARIIHRKENIGYLQNVNETAKQANAEFLLILQNDTLFTEDYWLDDLIQYMKDNEECAVISSYMCGFDGTGVIGNAFIREDGKLFCSSEKLSDRPYSVPYIQPAACLIRREVWQRLGGYDEVYSPAWCEDLDLYLRVIKEGYDIVMFPSKSFIHYGSKTYGNPPRKIFDDHYEILRERHKGTFLDVQETVNMWNKTRGLG